MAVELKVIILCRDEAEAEDIMDEIRQLDCDIIESETEEV